MSFHSSVKSLISKYGSQVTIKRDDKTVSTKAFIQPLRYKSKVISDKAIAFSGYTDSRYYLYIGQAGNEFSRNDNAIITSCGKQYVIHSSETFELYSKALYVWAVLTPYKSERRDDYEAD